MKTLEKVLLEIDNKTELGFELYYLIELLNMPKEQLQREESQYECMAMEFHLADDYSSRRKSFYIPGKEHVDITVSHIEYWKERAKQTKNPLLKFRYTGLVWDYEKEIIAKESSYEAIKKPNIEAAIECMNSFLKINIHISMSLIRNAIDKSISIGNTDLIKATVNAMIKYVDNTIESKDYCVSESLKFVVDRKNNVDEQIIFELVEMAESLYLEYLNQYQNTDSILTHKDKISYGRIEGLALALATYYCKNKKEKVEKIFSELRLLIIKHSDNEPSSRIVCKLNELRTKCIDFNVKSIVDLLNEDIHDYANRGTSGVEQLQITQEISNDMINRYFEPLMSGNVDNVITRFIDNYIPNVSAIRYDFEKEWYTSFK